MVGIVALVLRFDIRCRTTESALSVALFEPIRADRDARVAGSSGETLHAFVTIEPPSFAAAFPGDGLSDPGLPVEGRPRGFRKHPDPVRQAHRPIHPSPPLALGFATSLRVWPPDGPFHPSPINA